MINRTLLKRIFPQVVFPQILACAGLVVLCVATALAQDQAPAQDQSPAATDAAAPAQAASQRTDGQIDMNVVHALDASPELKSDLITAATIEGEVTLSGTVASDASSKMAESIASHVDGVTKVNNNLKVGNPQEAQAGEAGAPPMAGNQSTPQAYPQQPPPEDEGQGPDEGQAPYPPQYRGQQPAPAYAAPTGPVTIGPGTLLQLRTSEPVTSKRAKVGQPVQFTVLADVAVGNVLAIPRGATVHGVVTEAKNVGAGDLGGSSVLALNLTSLDLGGQSYPLDANQLRVKGPNKTGHTVGSAVGGGILGTIIGCAVGRGVGCAVGAGAGVAAGTAASAASPGPGIWIPAEARVDFHLKSPLTVTPVSAQEAARLSQGLYRGGTNLYRRGYYPYGYPYYGYPYGYPPVYYRPYYTTGGYYYWR
jgi:hypothetical protein